MTNQEIIATGQTIANETHIGGNTAERVGGVIQGIGENLTELGGKVGVIDEVVTESTETYNFVNNTDLTWSEGMVRPNGTVIQSSSYIRSNKFEVKSGDSVALIKRNTSPIVKALRLCAYSGNIPITDAGIGDDFSFPYIVPNNIDGIVITLNQSLLSDNPYAQISSERTRIIPTFYTKNEIGDISELDDSLVDTLKNNKSSISQIKDDVYDIVTEEVTETIDCSFSSGYMNPNGTIGGTGSYSHSNKISVKSGDVINFVKGTSGNITYAVRLCAYSGDIIVASAGMGDDFYFPYNVPDGIDGIVVSFSNTAISEGAKAIITRFVEEETPTFYTKSETDSLLEEKGNVKTVNNIHPDINGNVEVTVENIRTLVNQESVIVSKTTEVVQTQIETVSNARNAANFGVLPSNDGVTNYANLQALLNSGGTIYIDVPGVYKIDGKLIIGSNTELIFGQNVWISKINNGTCFIVNAGALTSQYNTDIKIKNLHLLTNGTSGSGSGRLGLRGIISFAYIKNLVLDSIYCDDFSSDTYFIHCCCWENILIQNCHIEGNKDGVHLATGTDATIRNCYFATGDDSIALNCHDYNSSIVEFGWIRNVLVENCVNGQLFLNGVEKNTARFALIFGGSWLDWENGNEYRNGDVIVAPNGYVYRLYMETDTAGTLHVSTVAPTHTSGVQTMSDGCKWLFIQQNTMYNCACENIVFRNIEIRTTHTQPFVFYFDLTKYDRSIYPGSVPPPHKNITLDNIKMYSEFHGNYFCNVRVPVENLRVINSRLSCTYLFWVNNSIGYAVTEMTRTLNLVFSGNYIIPNSSVLILMNANSGRIVNVKANNNYLMQNVSLHNELNGETCNMIDNDLW